MYLVDTNILLCRGTDDSGRRPRLDGLDGPEQRRAVPFRHFRGGGGGRHRQELQAGRAPQAERLSEWLGTLLHLYSARVLPIDLSTARRIDALADHARGLGQAPGMADLAIAATAQQHGYTILTRNMRHFGGLDVLALDPVEVLPSDIE